MNNIKPLHAIILLVVIFGFFISSLAVAGGPPLSSLRVVPNPAPAGTPIYFEGAETINCFTNIESTVERSDSVVTLRFGVEIGFCPPTFPPPGTIHRVALGVFEPGDYTLLFYSYNMNNPEFSDPNPIIISFSVLPPHSIPTESIYSFVSLLALILAAAFWTLRSFRCV